MRRILTGLLAATIAACGTGSGATGVSGLGGGTSFPLDSTSVSSGSSVGLRIGQAARITGTGIAFRFVELREDSRCPVGAQCVQAGNAQIALETRSASGALATAILNLTPDVQFTSSTSVNGVTIRFESLTPVPAVNLTIARTQYVASFAVTTP